MTAPLIPIAWCLYCPHGEVADDPQTAHTALEHHYTHHHPVEHLSEPPKPFGQPAWLRAGAVIMVTRIQVWTLGGHRSTALSTEPRPGCARSPRR